MKKVIMFASFVFIISLLFSNSMQAKSVVAEVNNTETVLLGGDAFGIRMFSDGVLVIEVEKSLFGTNDTSPAIEAGIEVNDVIKKVNGKTLYSNEEFAEIISLYKEKPLNLLIERNGEYIETELVPKYDAQGKLRAGLWIKDSAAGIGTITYFDTEDKIFGALGHGICESNTGKLMPIYYGEIAFANIIDVTESENGKVGSLNGYFDGDAIGKVNLNSNCGIFGTFVTEPDRTPICVADKKDVRIGDAQIYCTLSDNIIKPYDIRIKKLCHQGDDIMVIEITDKELLDLTGGIVQGMSGSPIVQNGKLVGAVTHVLVNNVKSGYGIYIEDMLDTCA